MKSLDLLWDYQTLDLKIDNLKKKKKASPVRRNLYKKVRYIKEQQETLKSLSNDIDKRNHIYNRIYHEFESINKDLKEDVKLIEHEEIPSLKQLDQIEGRMAEAQEKLDEKNKELSVLSKDMEGLNKKLRDMNVRLRKAKKEYDKNKAEYDEEMESMDSKIHEIKSQQKTLADKIDDSLLDEYRSIKGNHSRVLARVQEERCGGCNMAVASLAMQNIRDKTSIIKCENCRRILYHSPKNTES